MLPRAGLGLGKTLPSPAFHWVEQGCADRISLWELGQSLNLQGQGLLPPGGLSVLVWRPCSWQAPCRPLWPTAGLWVTPESVLSCHWKLC